MNYLPQSRQPLLDVVFEDGWDLSTGNSTNSNLAVQQSEAAPVIVTPSSIASLLSDSRKNISSRNLSRRNKKTTLIRVNTTNQSPNCNRLSNRRHSFGATFEAPSDNSQTVCRQASPDTRMISSTGTSSPMELSNNTISAVRSTGTTNISIGDNSQRQSLNENRIDTSNFSHANRNPKRLFSFRSAGGGKNRLSSRSNFNKDDRGPPLTVVFAAIPNKERNVNEDDDPMSSSSQHVMGHQSSHNERPSSLTGGDDSLSLTLGQNVSVKSAISYTSSTCSDTAITEVVSSSVVGGPSNTEAATEYVGNTAKNLGVITASGFAAVITDAETVRPKFSRASSVRFASNTSAHRSKSPASMPSDVHVVPAGEIALVEDYHPRKGSQTSQRRDSLEALYQHRIGEDHIHRIQPTIEKPIPIEPTLTSASSGASNESNSKCNSNDDEYAPPSTLTTTTTGAISLEILSQRRRQQEDLYNGKHDSTGSPNRIISQAKTRRNEIDVTDHVHSTAHNSHLETPEEYETCVEDSHANLAWDNSNPDLDSHAFNTSAEVEESSHIRISYVPPSDESSNNRRQYVVQEENVEWNNSFNQGLVGYNNDYHTQNYPRPIPDQHHPTNLGRQSSYHTLGGIPHVPLHFPGPYTGLPTDNYYPHVDPTMGYINRFQQLQQQQLNQFYSLPHPLQQQMMMDMYDVHGPSGSSYGINDDSSRPISVQPQRTLIRVSPHQRFPYIGSEETIEAYSRGHVVETNCTTCSTFLYCINCATLVLCPSCETISDLVQIDTNASRRNIIVDESVGVGLTVDHVTEILEKREGRRRSM